MLCTQDVHLLSQLVLTAGKAKLQLIHALRTACSPEGFFWQDTSRLARLQGGRKAVRARPVLSLLQAQVLILGSQGQQALPLLIDERLGACQRLKPCNELSCWNSHMLMLELGDSGRPSLWPSTASGRILSMEARHGTLACGLSHLLQLADLPRALTKLPFELVELLPRRDAGIQAVQDFLPIFVKILCIICSAYRRRAHAPFT